MTSPLSIQAIFAATELTLSLQPGWYKEKAFHPIADCRGHSRHWRIVAGLEYISFLARKHTTVTWPELGHMLGRNHSTLITASDRLVRKMDSAVPIKKHWNDPRTKKQIIEHIARIELLARKYMEVNGGTHLAPLAPQREHVLASIPGKNDPEQEGTRVQEAIRRSDHAGWIPNGEGQVSNQHDAVSARPKAARQRQLQQGGF